MAPVTFLMDSYNYNRCKNLDHVAEFTLHFPSTIWEWATYFHLKNAGFDVTLSDKMPTEGIVQVSSCGYDLMQKPPANVLLIDTLADTPPRFFSHIHVSQNPWQHRDFSSLLSLPVWRYINIWPQPAIIPRASSRENKFENIGFFGHKEQLEPSLQTEEFSEELAQLGLKLIIVDRDFNDYTNIDAVIAIRDFTGNPQYHKPNSKLINGWKASVPVLATNETAFVAMKESDLDYIEVSSKGELLKGLLKLKSNAELVTNMVASGKRRVLNYSEEKIRKDWEKLLFDDAQQLYENWRKKSNLEKEAFYASQLFSRGFRSIKKRVKSKIGLSKTY